MNTIQQARKEAAARFAKEAQAKANKQKLNKISSNFGRAFQQYAGMVRTYQNMTRQNSPARGPTPRIAVKGLGSWSKPLWSRAGERQREKRHMLGKKVALAATLGPVMQVAKWPEAHRNALIKAANARAARYVQALNFPRPVGGLVTSGGKRKRGGGGGAKAPAAKKRTPPTRRSPRGTSPKTVTPPLVAKPRKPPALRRQPSSSSSSSGGSNSNGSNGNNGNFRTPAALLA
jgi:hypothetical protein